nr:ER lumen protein-retaining receptor erd-2.2 [Citrullus colocynthis]
MKVPRRPIHAITTWVRRQPPKMKAFLGVVSAIISLVLLYVMVHDHNKLFVAAEAVHAIGIAVLIYKLMKERSCAGLSLKSQELTAYFLAARLYCSFVIEYDVHTFLDLATLVATLWVIYMIRYKLKASYMGDKDNFKVLYLVVPCILLAILIHPTPARVSFLQRIFWAFCVYLEAVSVLPQLRVMQNIKVVLPLYFCSTSVSVYVLSFFTMKGLFIITEKVTINFTSSSISCTNFNIKNAQNQGITTTTIKFGLVVNKSSCK